MTFIRLTWSQICCHEEANGHKYCSLCGKPSIEKTRNPYDVFITRDHKGFGDTDIILEKTTNIYFIGSLHRVFPGFAHPRGVFSNNAWRRDYA